MKDRIGLSFFMEKISCEVDEKAAILQEVVLPNQNKDTIVFLKREDLLHPTISGNKWRKLKYNLIEADKMGLNTLLTFGGAYSNHIYATASAGNIFGFKTIGIVRGEEHLPLNPTLTFAKECGMAVHYIDRTNYRNKRKKKFINELHKMYGEFYLIPEGGTNKLAIKGCTEIFDEINIDFDHILTACGTGGTIAGLICGLSGQKNIVGIPVLKGADFLNDSVSSYVFEYNANRYKNWRLNLDFHFGGYAKINRELIQFIERFKELNKITLDPIYTGKLMYALNSMIDNNEPLRNTTIIALHTGGLQGIAGMKNKIDNLLS